MGNIVRSEYNELANQISGIKDMRPEDVNELTVSVVDTTRMLSETNDEIDFLSGALTKLSETKDEYNRKAKRVKRQLTDLATKL